MDNLSLCGNCKFGNDRGLGGNRLVCLNEVSDSSEYVVREHWAACDYFAAKEPQSVVETLDWDEYRQRQQTIQDRDSDRVMSPRKCW